MKLPHTSPGAPGIGKAPAAAGPDFANLWHPAQVEFTGGVEVTEVLDSMPAELLELFQLQQPKGKP